MEKLGRTRAAGVQIVFSVDEAYSHSSVRIWARARGPFVVRVVEPAYALRLDVGFESESGGVVAERRGEIFEVNLQAAGFFAHTPVRRSERLRVGRGPGEERAEYTVRMFPFVSSAMIGELILDSPVAAVTFEFPSKLRAIWQATSVSIAEDQAPVRRTAHYPHGWQEVFRANQAGQGARTVAFQFRVHTSGREITRRIVSPVLALAAFVISSAPLVEYGGARAVVAALAALAAVFSREALTTERSHQLQAQTVFLAVLLAAAVVWTVVLLYWASWWPITVASIAFVVADLVRSSAQFEYSGRLPRRYERPLGWLAVFLEKRRASRRAAAGVDPFDFLGDDGGERD